MIFNVEGFSIIVENNEAYFVSQDYYAEVKDGEFSDMWNNKYRIIGNSIYRLEWKCIGSKA